MKTRDYDWNGLRALGSAANLPEAMEALVSAADEDAADRAYWRIDNTALVQGALHEASLPVQACLQEGIHRATRFGRVRILELMLQIGSGETAPTELTLGNDTLSQRCREALVPNGYFFSFLLETGSREEQEYCVDLVALCADVHLPFLAFGRRVLEIYADTSEFEALARLARDWVAELPAPSS